MALNPVEYLNETARETRACQDRVLNEFQDQLVLGAQWLGETVRSGGKVLILGNGGSAADAQHMAAEMVGRMLIERRALPAIALTTDSSNLTAIGNDYGYDFIFSRQVEALAQPKDLVIAISTSGKSRNVLEAVRVAKKIGCRTLALTGGDGGALAPLVDLAVVVRGSRSSSRIQESHIFVIHTWVDLMDRYFLSSPDPGRLS